MPSTTTPDAQMGGALKTDKDLSMTGNFSTSGSIVSYGTGGIGYSTGAGAVVTQITNRSTGVTCNAICGAITTTTASLAAEGTASFGVSNSYVRSTDTVVVCQRSGSDGGGTIAYVSAVANGSFTISLYNGNVASGTAETGAIILNFAVIKAVAT
jgi:hypothetical protein